MIQTSHISCHILYDHARCKLPRYEELKDILFEDTKEENENI